MVRTLFKYLSLWFLLSKYSFLVALTSRFGAVIFLLGKILRFLIQTFFIYILISRTKVFAGYTLSQAFLFYLIFNLIDTTTQFLYREVYRFRPQIVSGSFDLTLAKPVNPLFKSLLGGADLLDLLMLIPFLLLIFYFIRETLIFNLSNFIPFFALLFNSFLIATSFHIFVLALGVLTTEIDHTIMIYRDLSSMARFPIDIYREPLRFFLTFILPIGVMMTFPAKVLLGLLSIKGVISSFLIGGLLFIGSLKLWNYSLSKYSSASS